MDATVKLNPVNGNWQVSNPRVKLPQDSGAHVITFDIIGNSSGITFAQDPLWVQMGSKPVQKPAPGSDNGQIGAWKVLNNGKQLVVVDWNDIPGDLHYALNFNGYRQLDPVIENGGGIKPPAPQVMWVEYATFALVALVSFVVGMFVYKRFFA